jgi:anthranilate phosphoribosyltransferase
MANFSKLSTASAEHPFAQYVRILGKGKSGTRSLSLAEAKAAFSMILSGEAEPMQVGAFLMLLRVKEETGEELAGFVQACTEMMLPGSAQVHADLDWSSYAGKKHQHPWFLLSIMLLVQAGYRVFIHGTDGHTQGRLYTEQALDALQLPVAENWQQVANQLDTVGLSYLPLRHLCAPLDELIHLRPLLGLRSPVHTLTRMLNPLRANASIQSIFHPAYGDLHREADTILEQPNALVFKGDSGEVEIKPQADTKLMFLNDGVHSDSTFKRRISERVASVDMPSVEPLRAMWRGECSDDYGLDAVLATTAVALSLLDPGRGMDESTKLAAELWQARDRERLPACP